MYLHGWRYFVQGLFLWLVQLWQLQEILFSNGICSQLCCWQIKSTNNIKLGRVSDTLEEWIKMENDISWKSGLK